MDEIAKTLPISEPLVGNNLSHLEEQVFYRVTYEYSRALSEYVMLLRIHKDTESVLRKIYLLGRILGSTPEEINQDINGTEERAD